MSVPIIFGWSHVQLHSDFARGSRPAVVQPVSDLPYANTLTTSWMDGRKRRVTHNGQGSFRKLTLNDFPMEHGVKDAQQRSVTSRQERSRLQDRLQSARKESETLREYSRRRFQNVVDWETRQIVQPPSTVPKIQTSFRPKTTAGTRQLHYTHPPLTPTTPTNGPTKDGSILYNGKPQLLSSIRTRPNSEPPSRFDHLRGALGKTSPYIQRTLEQSNCEYRVGATPCHTAREDGALSPDFVMLIPVTSEASDVFDDDCVSEQDSPKLRNGQAWMGEGEEEEEAPLLTSTARSLSPESEGRAESHQGVDKSGEGDKTPTTPPPGIAIPRIVQEQPSPTPSPRHPATPPRDIPSPVLTKPPSTSSALRRPPSARSDASSVSSVSITPRPHCWVDDVTVSSDESLPEREQSLHNDLDERLSVHSQDSATRSLVPGSATHLPRVGSPGGGDKQRKTLPLGKRVSSPLLKRSPSGGKAKTGGGGGGGGCPRSLKQSTTSGSKAGARSVVGGRQEGGLEVVREGEAGEEQLALPRFVCPSSESKSRQAAIKEWLAKTSFATACRTVPLM